MMSTPKLILLLLSIFIAFTIFQAVDGEEAAPEATTPKEGERKPFVCYKCEDPSGEKCGGKLWIKAVKDNPTKEDCALNVTMCVAVFSSEDKGVFRGCLSKERTLYFVNKICVEGAEELEEDYLAFKGVNVCACDKRLCNVGVGAGTVIEVKFGLIFGVAVFLLGMHFFK